jgi:sigma-B regulation protein RsbU (phosphoserine phosphatase)
MKGPGLTFKLIVFILLSTTVIFCTAFYYGHLATRDVVFGLVEENARYLTSATINEIETVLRGIEKITLQTASLIERYPYVQEDLYHLITSAVSSNPEIYGSAIAFQPYAFNPELYFFSPYCFQEKPGQTKLVFLGSEDYDYFSMDWYRQPMELNKPTWSEPYFDKGGGNIVMATFSAPFYKNINGVRTFQGVVTADISLAWLRKIVSSIKIYDTGYAFLISEKGYFVTHPNKQFIMRENIFSLSEAKGDKKALRVAKYMVRGGQGFVGYQAYISGKKSWMYYAAVPATGWSLGVVFPEDELFASVTELARKVVLVSLVGFALLLVVIAFIARTIIKPVRYLATTTEEIAHGNLDIELPEPTSNDEIAALTHSFIEMKSALKNYIANLAETAAAKERIESELKIARAIQMSFLPKRFPPFPQKNAFEIFADLEPAKEIGGDFYDFFLLDEEQLFFTIGDVSGKGIPAALFMAVTKTLIKGVAGSNAELSEVVRRVNLELCLDNEAMMFATVFCGILNFSSGQLRYTNAGHLPPLLVRFPNDPQWLPMHHGIALGVDEEASYQTQTAMLQPGDSIVLYTDGVTEAMNGAYQLYSSERLLATVRVNNMNSSEGCVHDIFNSVRTFASGMPQSDDITVLALALRHCHK